MPSVIGQDTTASGFDPGLATPPMTYGVWGDTGSGTGVVGSSSHPAPAAATIGGAGVYGLNNAAGGLGVRGQADDETGTAVLGRSALGTGVTGRSEGTNPGVFGISAQGAGVSGQSATGVAVRAESTNGTAVHALHPTTSGGAVEARLATGQRAGDFTGDVLVTGDLTVTRKVGVGTPTPQAPLGIRGTGPAQELLSFEDGTGAVRWHVSQNVNGTPGLNFGETGVAEGRLFLGTGGRVGVGTTTPSHPFHVSGFTGLRQNELYLSGGLGWSSISFNAHHNASNGGWVFPDPSRHAVTVEMDDWTTVPRFQVWTTPPENKQDFVKRFDINGKTGNVTFPAGRVGVRTENPSFELEVNGTACATQFCNPSDVRLKRDVTPVPDALTRLAAVRGVSYQRADKGGTGGRQLGVIAQEVEPMFPELVVEMNSAGHKAVDYNGLVGVLVAAVNELGARNAALAERLAAVEGRFGETPGSEADDDG